MNEQQWMTSTDAAAMLEWLRSPDYRPVGTAASGQFRGAEVSYGFSRISPRKLRLFACACCRAVWDRLTDPRSRCAVEVAERYADGEATWGELSAARVAAWDAARDAAWVAAWAAARVAARTAAWVAARAAARVAARTAARSLQADLLRCIAGNPWQPYPADTWPMGGTKPVPLWPDEYPWLTPNALARAAYADRDWALLPILADALEEEGCEADEPCGCTGGYSQPARTLCGRCGATGRVPNPILAHLRGGGPHCRGCFAVDLVLGKE